MSLLDFNMPEMDSPQGQGLLSAAFSLMQAKGPSLSNAIGQAGGQYMDSYGRAKENAAQEEVRRLQIDAYKRKMEQEKAAMELAARQRQATGKLFSVSGGGGGFSPTLGKDGMPVFDGAMNFSPVTPPKLQLNQAAVMEALAAGVPAKDIQEYAALQNLGKSKVARTIEVQRPDGVYTVQVDEFGMPISQGDKKYTAPTEVGQGDRKTFVDFAAGGKPILSVPVYQSPDSKASNALGWANYAVSKANSDRAASKEREPQYSSEAGGFIYKPDMKNPNGRIVPLNGANGAVKMTEDQAKASGWLAQAENSWSNMKGVGIDKNGKVTSAAKPGINDALSAVGLETLGNAFRTSDRQQFMQASSSLSEALLRAATGAGVNKEEAAQKIKEITPAFGDSDAVIKQKFDSVPVYLETLKMRAGPGAPKVQSIMNNRAPVGGVQFLGWE